MKNLLNKFFQEFQDELDTIGKRPDLLIFHKSNFREELGYDISKLPHWGANERLSNLNNLLKKLKIAIQEIQKRDFLSITPKVEDLKLVYKWIETFNVPHYYFQVFFDKIFGISFESILELVADSDNEGKIFSVEKDTKNQNKTTIKINSKSGLLIANKVIEPAHKSFRKEMARGRLLFYVSFEGGKAYLNLKNLTQILGITKGEF